METKTIKSEWVSDGYSSSYKTHYKLNTDDSILMVVYNENKDVVIFKDTTHSKPIIVFNLYKELKNYPETLNRDVYNSIKIIATNKLNEFSNAYNGTCIKTVIN